MPTSGRAAVSGPMRTVLVAWIVSAAGVLVSRPGGGIDRTGERVTLEEDWGTRMGSMLDAYNLTDGDAGKADAQPHPARPARPLTKKDPCLIVYHISKSGGESLHRWFTDNNVKFWTHYHPSNELRPKYPTLNPKSDRGPHCKFTAADVYMGHWAPEVTQDLLAKDRLKRKCYEVTLLRNPLERTASQLFYSWRGVTQAGLIGNLRPQKQNSSLNHPDPSKAGFGHDVRWYSNHICRQFSGLTKTYNVYDKKYGDDLNTTCDVARARAGLLRMDFVGFIEDIGKFVNTLADMLEMPKTGRKSLKRKNKSENPSFKKLMPELQQIIRKFNDEDAKLYAWAARSFLHL